MTRAARFGAARFPYAYDAMKQRASVIEPSFQITMVETATKPDKEAAPCPFQASGRM